jgi:DNA polymerase IV
MSMGRHILHVDMDAFFASVEQLDHPDYRGKPVLVGGSSRRGVVSAASYEARAFGCRSAMPIGMALRLCPQAIVTPVRGSRYREVSEQVFQIFDRFTPLIEPLSVDEAFLDVGGSLRIFGSAVEIGRQIRKTIRTETGLTASVGVAPNKFLAKLASDMNKPDGMTVITTDNLRAMIDPLPVGRVWGIGGKAADRLGRMNIRSVGDLRAAPIDLLQRLIGSWAIDVRNLIDGIDDRAVTPDSDAKSVGQEHTFEENLHDVEALHDVLIDEVEQVATRLRRKGRFAGTVTLKIRYADFKTITRRAKLDVATNQTQAIWKLAERILLQWAEAGLAPIRLLGVSCSDLSATAEPRLFDQAESGKQASIDKALDQINARFGNRTVSRGRHRSDREN